MHVALWDFPPTDCLLVAAEAQMLEVEQAGAEACTRLLLERQVDVALLPSTVVLGSPDTFAVLPGAAISTWAYPFARIMLRRGLGHVGSVAYHGTDTIEALLTRIVFQEHYGLSPAFVVAREASAGALLQATEDASLLVGRDVPALPEVGVTLDLGREWYELAQYPMVWGLFVTLRELASPAAANAVIALAVEAERQATAGGTSPMLRRFYTQDMRFRLDDLAMAGLTKLRDFLYYYKVTDEIADPTFYSLPAPEADSWYEADISSLQGARSWRKQ